MNLKGLCGIFVAWLAVAGVAFGQTWTSQGVGSVGVSGTFTELSADAFSVMGSGSEIGGGSGLLPVPLSDVGWGRRDDCQGGFGAVYGWVE